jgi:hypothetical protein
MAHDLGADLHEFFPQAGQRPLLNSRRPHSSLDRITPDQAYFPSSQLAAA